MLERLPSDLKVCPQWLLWKPKWIEEQNKWTKVPISQRTGFQASVRKPSDWCSFEAAVATYTEYHKQAELGGLGLVLGYASGTSGADLDNALYSDGSVASYEAVEIARRFETYTEISPSGTGLHCLFKASVPDGRRTKGVELYGEGRYFTMTGNPYFDLPLSERQATADALREYIDLSRNRAVAVNVDWSVEAKYTHEQVWQMATTAENGQKFFDLFHGRWQSYYGSHSEADIALVNILAFYTDSPTQVMFMFQGSELYRTATDDKYRKRPTLLQNMIAKAFDQKVPLIAIPPITHQVVTAPPPPEPEPEHDAEDAAARADNPFTLPPGNSLVGRIAQYVHDQAMYQMPEAALCAALALMAGICGRQYQYGAKGLNLYLMLLANTGSGKEAMSTGIGSIMEAVCDPPRDLTAAPTTNIEGVGYPSARQFRGPAKLTGKGLMISLAKCDVLSMFSILNEFADTMKQMADPRANQGMSDLKTALLDLYMKSSEGNAYAGHVTADKDTSIKALSSPAFTFLSECTPAKLYSYLNEDLIADGLLPRMIIFESEKYGKHNPHHHSVKVPADVVRDVTIISKIVFDNKIHGDKRIQVRHGPGTAERSEEFRRYARARLMAVGADNTGSALGELWNRAHLNTERIAGLVAIGCDPFNPIVTVEQFDWAARIIVRQITLLVGKFKRGETGDVHQDDKTQLSDLVAVIKSYALMTPDNMPKAHAYCADARRANCIPFRFLQQRTSNMASYRKDRRGHLAALRGALDAAIKMGMVAPARLDGHSATFYEIKSL